MSLPPDGRSSRTSSVLKGLGLAAASAAVFLLVSQGVAPNPEGGTPASWRVDEALDEVLRTEGVDRGTFAGSAPEGGPAELRADVPAEAGLTRMNVEISRAVRGAGARVFESIERGRDPEAPEAVDLEVGAGEDVTHRLTIRRESGKSARKGAPRIALVFDDLGYTVTGLAAELLELPAPLTFAVLPGLPHSRDFARAAAARGHEVILHVPMEPVDRRRHDPGDDALFVELAPAENLRRLRGFLDGFSGYVGVSNHMGSRFTSRPELMEPLMAELRRRDRGLFFLDSRTTPYSSVGEAARRAGVPCITNNLFLDGGDEGPRLARVRTDRVASIARRRGHAVAIGHMHRETVDAVRDAVARWNREGIRLVGLSDLMHR